MRNMAFKGRNVGMPPREKVMTNPRLLTKSGRESCIPTEEELRNYLATPDDEVAAKLRKELSPESFDKIGFIILYTEKIEKAQDTKSVKAIFEWGEEWCPHTTADDTPQFKRECDKCWQALKRGIGTS